MGKFGGFLSRMPVISDSRAPTPIPDNPLELDEELFSTLGARVGGENEALRNLLLNASTKINELELDQGRGRQARRSGRQGARRLRNGKIGKDRAADRPQQYAHRLRQAA